MADAENNRPPSILSAIRRAQARTRGADPSEGASERAPRSGDKELTVEVDAKPLVPSPTQSTAGDTIDAALANDSGAPGAFEIPPEQLRAAGDSSDARWRFEQWARNPECRANAISAVHGIPMAHVAALEGLEPASGQSTFLLTRAVTFERDLFADGASRLLKALADKEVVAEGARGLKDLRTRQRGGPQPDVEASARATEALLRRIAQGGTELPAVVAGATVQLGDEGFNAFVTVDSLAVIDAGDARELVVGVVKTFPDRGGYTEPRELVTARAQAGLYVHALRGLVSRLDLEQGLQIRSDGFVVMTRPGSLFPVVRAGEDFGFQAERARRGLEMLRAASDDAASFDSGAKEPAEALARVETTYRESCVGFCERAEKCHEAAYAASDPVILGDDAKRFLGSIALPRALELLGASAPQDAAEQDLARRMREGEDRTGGSKGSDVVRRLRAHQAGGPLRYGATLHFQIASDEDLLILAFVRMGGESRPWGIACGHPGAEPTVVTVPEGRDRDLVADMCAELAPVLLRHLRTPGFISEAGVEPTDLRPLRQVWLPNASHLDMLHHLAYAYVRWNREHEDLLNAIGRASGWLFRESQRPGQQHVVVATQALTEAYTFPAQNARQHHLGYLLAWLDATGDLASRTQAASEAEKLSVSTALDPDFEREETEPLVNRWGRVRLRGEEDVMARTAAKLHRKLEPELRRRFELTERAIAEFREDDRPPMRGIDSLVTAAVEEQWREYTNIELRLTDTEAERPFIPSPETDVLPVIASKRYLVHLASQERLRAILIHNDAELLEEAIASGDAFRGTVASVTVERDGANQRPVWTIRSRDQGQLRLREESWVCVAGHPDLTGILRSLTDLPEKGREYRVAFKGNRAAQQAASTDSHIGSQVVIVNDSSLNLLNYKISLMAGDSGPGDWLTHATPGKKRSRLDDDETGFASVNTGGSGV